MSMHQNISRLLAVSVLLLACGCKSPEAIVFVTTTHVGVEANAGEGGQQQAHVGYRRFEGVVMPHRKEKKAGEKIGRALTNAFSVASRFDLHTGSLWLPALSLNSTGAFAPMTLHQTFASGAAAVDPNTLESLDSDHRVLSGQIATDSESKTIKLWVNSQDAETRKQRRQAIADWIKGKSLATRVHDFIYEPAEELSRKAFVQERGGANALISEP